MTRSTAWCVGLSLVLGMFASPVQAETETRAAAANTPMASCCGKPSVAVTRYPVFAKLGRGVSNLLGGWLEIPATMHAWYSKQDTAGSLIGGSVHGLLRGVARTAVGAFETVTFLLPIPRDYAPILPTLGYFQSATRSSLPLE